MAAPKSASPELRQDALAAPSTARPSDTPAMDPAVLRARLDAAVRLLFVADALSMPAHWIYNHAAQQQICGQINDYQAAPTHAPHPDSWDYYQHVDPKREQAGWPAELHIYHNNPDLYQKPGTHYHHGMVAGDNTLHARLQEVLMNNIVATAQTRQNMQAGAATASNDTVPAQLVPYEHEDFCKRMLAYLTTPGAHTDTYIGGALRHFFRHFASDPSRSFEGKGYDDPCVGGLVLVLPLLLLQAASAPVDDPLALEQQTRSIERNLFLTHASPLLLGMAMQMLQLLSALLHAAESSAGRVTAEHALRHSLSLMMQANSESTRDKDAACSFAVGPKAQAKMKAAKTKAEAEAQQLECNDAAHATVVVPIPDAAAAAAADAAAAAPPPASSPLQDPVYLAWKAAQVSAPDARVWSIDELLDMSDADAFAACFSVRCYAERALPGAVYLALKSLARPSGCGCAARSVECPGPLVCPLLRNANLGGDNAHRGMLLAVLLGALHGASTPLAKHWKDGVRPQPSEHARLEDTMHAFVEVCMQRHLAARKGSK